MKGKEISLFFIPNLKIKPEKKDLALGWLSSIGTGCTVNTDTFSGSQNVCHEYFEKSRFEAELQTRLGFRKLRRLRTDAVATTFNFNPTQSHGQQERGERVQKLTKKVRSVS